jgi:hypothetical protein
LSFFHSPLPFAIPFPARFEHTHIVGSTGHGKAQLMQFFNNHDLVRSIDDRRSFVVIDSQGDLIRAISRLAYFNPLAADSLADRFVLVDPNDVEHPVCLNMFDFNRDRLSGYPYRDPRPRPAVRPELQAAPRTLRINQSCPGVDLIGQLASTPRDLLFVAAYSLLVPSKQRMILRPMSYLPSLVGSYRHAGNSATPTQIPQGRPPRLGA